MFTKFTQPIPPEPTLKVTEIRNDTQFHLFTRLLVTAGVHARPCPWEPCNQHAYSPSHLQSPSVPLFHFLPASALLFRPFRGFGVRLRPPLQSRSDCEMRLQLVSRSECVPRCHAMSCLRRVMRREGEGRRRRRRRRRMCSETTTVSLFSSFHRVTWE